MQRVPTRLRQLAPRLRLHGVSASAPRAAQAPTRRLASEASPTTARLTDPCGVGPKRFYDNVTTARRRTPSGDEHAVLLDGKPVLTPQGGVLATPTVALSTALAAEWDAQESRVRAASMPLTRLVTTAREAIPARRAAVVATVVRYVHTDAVCLRPGAPRELVEAQDAACGPVVRRLREAGLELAITRGGLHAAQGDAVETWVRTCAEGLDDYSLAALEGACGCAKSVAVALALLKGVAVEHAIDAARAEERWQTRVWGVVQGGHDLDEADLEVRLRAADMVFRFVEQEPEAFRRVREAEGGA